MPSLVERSVARALPGFEESQIWCADLDQPTDVIDRLASLLSPSEGERVKVLRGAPARRRFIVRRATLRMILAEKLGATPQEVRFEYGPDGKPGLATPGAPVYHFNLTHSRDVALVALSCSRPVGIDVEWTDGSSAIEGVVRRYFSAAERGALDEASDDARRRLFFRIWVRKEAYLKGRGEGISQWIYETDYSTLTHGLDRSTDTPIRDQDNWIARDVTGLPSGFVGSLALAWRAS